MTCPYGHAFTWRGCFSTKLAHSFLSIFVLLQTKIFHLSFFPPTSFSQHICSFLDRTFLSVFAGLSPIFNFFTSLLFATSLFLGGILEDRHVDSVPRPVSLEDGMLVIEVTVGLPPLSANTSLWSGRWVDGRSGRARPDQPVGGTSLVVVFHQGQLGILSPQVYIIHNPDVRSLADTFSSSHYSSQFRELKRTAESKPLNFKSNNTENYNLPFSKTELKQVCKNLIPLLLDWTRSAGTY